MDIYEILKPDDFHIHLRQGADLPQFARDAAKSFARVLVMPNTLPPIQSAPQLEEYRAEIKKAAPTMEPLMTFKIKEGMNHALLKSLQSVGAVAGKYYPKGVTTNSQDGIEQVEALYPVFAIMEELDLILCLHGEDPYAFCLDREVRFLRHVEAISANFPKLRVILEHLSTREAVECVNSLPANVAATITVHHMLLTLDDLIGGCLQPHHFCKPVVKRPEDRAALVEAAFSGNPKFFLGTDSAPHNSEHKESCCGAAGVYSAPVSLPLLIDFFETHGKLAQLEPFCSHHGADFYRLPRNTNKLKFIRRPWQVPKTYGNVVPFMADKYLQWDWLEA
jgi:dihydroorotase